MMARSRRQRAELDRQADVDKIVSDAIQLRERVAVLGSQLQTSVNQLRSEIDRFAISVGAVSGVDGSTTPESHPHEPAGEEGTQ
jgi:hypothetical protein